MHCDGNTGFILNIGLACTRSGFELNYNGYNLARAIWHHYKSRSTA